MEKCSVQTEQLRGKNYEKSGVVIVMSLRGSVARNQLEAGRQGAIMLCFTRQGQCILPPVH